MKLSDLDPKDVIAVGESSKPLRLSDLHPKDVTPVETPEPSLGQKAKGLFESTVVDQLPSLGAAAGGAIGGLGGGAALGVGAVPGALGGAGIGGYLGKAVENAYNSAVRPDKAPKDTSELLGSPIKSGAEGVAMEGLGMGAGKALGNIADSLGNVLPSGNKVLDYLKDKAALKATRSLGRPTPTEATRMASSGQDVKIGRDLLDSDAIPWLGTPNRIAARVEDVKDQVGQKIGNLIKSGGDSKLIDSEKIGLQILDSPELANMRKTPGMESTAAAIEKQVETLAKNGELTLSEAQALRQRIDKSINFNKSAPDMRGAQEGLYQQRTALRNAMNEGINALPNAPEKDALLNANQRYGNLSTASDILDREIGRNQTNRAVSGTDTIASVGGLLKGGPIGAVVAGGLNKFGRTFGNSIQARGLDATANMLGKFGPAIKAASERGPEALGSTLSILRKNPEFTKLLDQLDIGLGQPALANPQNGRE